jgi:hypothetical protein
MGEALLSVLVFGAIGGLVFLVAGRLIGKLFGLGRDDNDAEDKKSDQTNN